MATRIRTLRSREYKLLLKPKVFAKTPKLDNANKVWRDVFLDVVRDQLGNDAIEPAKSGFDKVKQRKILFWDTPDGDLARSNYSLRERRGKKSPPQLSLKLRTPDLFVASATRLPAEGASESTFEEDIAPLAVRSSRGTASPHVSLPDEYSTRSRFSRSAEIEAEHPETFGDLVALFPTLASNLRATGADIPGAATGLISGVEVEEFAFKGISASLGHGYELEFTLSVWVFPEEPRVVEISYKCDTRNGRMKRAAAQESLDLFLAIQKQRLPLIETEETSKTARALPKRVGSP